MLLTRIAAAACVIGLIAWSSPSHASSTVSGAADAAIPASILPTASLLEDGYAPQSGVDSAAEPIAKTLTVGKGDTLMKLLMQIGVSATEADSVIAALRPYFDPRRMSIGQTIEVQLEQVVEQAAEVASRLMSLHVIPDYDRLLRVARTSEDDFRVFQEERQLKPNVTLAAGRIDSSLYEAAIDAGLPQPVLLEMIKAFSWDVDFQRDIQPGDTFEVMYERFFDDAGSVVHNGDVLVASMVLSGQRMILYRFDTQDGATDFYDGKGRSVRKALLRTPVDGARLSSGFGRRTHPILGYSKMHTGVDFATPKGTPIYAAGDGTVERAGWFGGYGKYIRIRHNTEYSTAYGHLNGFAKGISAGKRVKQGQVIGYVGSTGRSTGPHLHYEILRNGAHTNPLKVRMPVGRQLEGRELKNFVAHRDAFDKRAVALREQREVADTQR